MKFNCGLTPAEKSFLRYEAEQKRIEYMINWHDWFAWYPVRVGSRDCRWLETVQRKYAGYSFNGRFSLIDDCSPTYREKA